MTETVTRVRGRSARRAADGGDADGDRRQDRLDRRDRRGRGARDRGGELRPRPRHPADGRHGRRGARQRGPARRHHHRPGAEPAGARRQPTMRGPSASTSRCPSAKAIAALTSTAARRSRWPRSAASSPGCAPSRGRCRSPPRARPRSGLDRRNRAGQRRAGGGERAGGCGGGQHQPGRHRRLRQPAQIRRWSARYGPRSGRSWTICICTTRWGLGLANALAGLEEGGSAASILAGGPGRLVPMRPAPPATS